MYKLRDNVFSIKERYERFDKLTIDNYNALCSILYKITVVVFSVVIVYEIILPPIDAAVEQPQFSLLEPNNSYQIPLSDVYNQLINLKNFNFTINPKICDSYKSGFLLIIFVSSNPIYFDKRATIRNTWGRSTNTTRIVFLIGDTDQPDVNTKIKNESDTYGDLVVGNFMDAYRNMTYKHMMGLKWVTHHCPQAKYILKTDDDAFININELRRVLTRELSPWGARNLILCSELDYTKPVRDPYSKYYVTPEEYSPEIYPRYCAVPVIMYSELRNNVFSIEERYEMFDKDTIDKHNALCSILHKVAVVLFSILIVYEIIVPPKPSIDVVVKQPQFSLLEPNNSYQIPVSDVYNQLIDLKNFNFAINPKICDSYKSGLLLIIVVSSNPMYFDKRATIRITWGRTTNTTRIVFLIGDTDQPDVNAMIKQESDTYGDLVVGNFMDAYRNMTYKHMMGLKWVTHHCPQAKYILKTDDDAFININELRRALARELSPWGARNLILCSVFTYTVTVRDTNSKWYVKPEEYSEAFYPRYCAGYVIIYSPDVASRLLTLSASIKYFWIDDAYVTGILAEILSIPRTDIGSLALNDETADTVVKYGSESVGFFIMGPKQTEARMIEALWRAVN